MSENYFIPFKGGDNMDDNIDVNVLNYLLKYCAKRQYTLTNVSVKRWIRAKVIDKEGNKVRLWYNSKYWTKSGRWGG